MLQLPAHHPDRFSLAEEVHARPPEAISAPGRVTYVAIIVDPDQRDAERAHIAALCEHFGVQGPALSATHHSTRLAGMRLKWERHGEFSGYTFLLEDEADQAPSFAKSAADLLPSDWLEKLPGQTIAATHCILIKGPIGDSSVQSGSVQSESAQFKSTQAQNLNGSHTLSELFSANSMVGARINDGAATAYTDFKLHAAAFTRFVLVDHGMTPRQTGQTAQRLFEIEVYRTLALLALPIARRQSPRILAIERALAQLTDGIARDGGNDETLLHELTRLAAEVESGLAASQFRFGACRAYHDLVQTRISELREQRITGMQTIDEFMGRRFNPAVATCTTVSQRLHDLSERVAQASGLLSTRVEITRERQNQALLSSMDSRAKMQLRLQQTVEGLSIAAIVYYLAGLTGYLAKALKAAGLKIDPDLAVGVSTPLLLLGVWFAVRRVRRSIAENESVKRII